MIYSLRRFVLVALVCVPSSAAGQGVVVDEGTFAVTIGGVPAGTETFVIRRPGVGRDDALFANGVVTLALEDGRHEARPLLHAAPPDGIAVRYQVSASGPDAIEVQVALSGRRYLATIRSAAGAEDREFQAHPDTRVLEQAVAHHYYFLRDVRPERAVHTLEPRTRTQGTVTGGDPIEETLSLGPNQVQSRRVVFTTDLGEERSVWYDRQGRVLKVEIPALSYVAQRTDLVG